MRYEDDKKRKINFSFDSKFLLLQIKQQNKNKMAIKKSLHVIRERERKKFHFQEKASQKD